MIVEYEKKYTFETEDLIKVKVALAKLNISQSTLSQKLGMATSYINRVLNGKTSANQNLLTKIEKMLNINLGE